MRVDRFRKQRSLLSDFKVGLIVDLSLFAPTWRSVLCLRHPAKNGRATPFADTGLEPVSISIRRNSP